MVSVLAMVVSAALEPVLPALMQPLIDKSLIERAGPSLWQVPVFIVLAFILKGVADYVASVASQTVAQKTIADLRALIFSHQLDLPMSRHRIEEGGRMLTRITYDTSMVGEAVSTAWLTIVRDTLVLVGLLAFLFYTAWQLTLLILLVAPALAIAIRRINGRLRNSSERVQSWIGKITGFIEESLAGLREIKIFGAHRTKLDRFEKLNQSLRREQMRVFRVQAINVPLVQVLAACSVALVIFVASSLSRQNMLSPGEFVAFITGMSMVFEPVRRLTNVNATLQRGLAAAESIFGILDERSERGTASLHSRTERIGRGQSENKVQNGLGIEFLNVSYRYPGSEDWAIKNFSIKIQPGEFIAVVGPSGSGKSTLLNLLCGFDDPTGGKIFIDQQDIKKTPLADLRANIALVGQQTTLFDLTVRENLTLARPNALEAEIIDALESANALDFVRSLPKGLDTPLGSLGNSLSGGQRQRLSLARAFLKNAPILFLDEATNALDRSSEAEVLSALTKLVRGKTTIMVSHRPETLLNISRLIKL